MPDVKKNPILDSLPVVEHLDITAFDVTGLVEAMGKTAFQARNLARAGAIYDAMLRDTGCAVIFTLAGSLVGAGQRRIIVELIKNKMIDVIVATGANIVDQDFLEALGFKHYQGDVRADDAWLRHHRIDRIYDTYISEDQLGVSDNAVAKIAAALDPRPYSSREFLREMGAWLVDQDLGKDSIIRVAYELAVPIFVPAFSDCSAGLGLLKHQWDHPEAHLTIDSARDFRELFMCKRAVADTGLVMLGGGVPKNFAQDITVAGEVIGEDHPMHKYAIQMTVADERDGGLSGSTLREARSWGKVDLGMEQMVYGEATVLFPLLAGYAYHKRGWTAREYFRFNDRLDHQPVQEAVSA